MALITDGLLVIVAGSLYPALQRLEKAGLVATSTEITDGRRRRIYEMTSEGKRALVEKTRSVRCSRSPASVVN